jgi:hypothetical protein
MLRGRFKLPLSRWRTGFQGYFIRREISKSDLEKYVVLSSISGLLKKLT